MSSQLGDTQAFKPRISRRLETANTVGFRATTTRDPRLLAASWAATVPRTRVAALLRLRALALEGFCGSPERPAAR